LLCCRWLDYTNVGRVIANTQFITFKVPLSEVSKFITAMKFEILIRTYSKLIGHIC